MTREFNLLVMNMMRLERPTTGLTHLCNAKKRTWDIAVKDPRVLFFSDRSSEMLLQALETRIKNTLCWHQIAITVVFSCQVLLSTNIDPCTGVRLHLSVPKNDLPFSHTSCSEIHAMQVDERESLEWVEICVRYDSTRLVSLKKINNSVYKTTQTPMHRGGSIKHPRMQFNQASISDSFTKLNPAVWSPGKCHRSEILSWSKATSEIWNRNLQLLPIVHLQGLLWDVMWQQQAKNCPLGPEAR